MFLKPHTYIECKEHARAKGPYAQRLFAVTGEMEDFTGLLFTATTTANAPPPRLFTCLFAFWVARRIIYFIGYFFGGLKQQEINFNYTMFDFGLERLIQVLPILDIIIHVSVARR